MFQMNMLREYIVLSKCTIFFYTKNGKHNKLYELMYKRIQINTLFHVNKYYEQRLVQVSQAKKKS